MSWTNVRGAAALSALLFLPLQLCAADEVPRQMVAHFSTQACPEGWNALQIGQGRLVLSTAKSGQTGVSSGAAMSNGTVPSHRHGMTVQLTVPATTDGFAASDCCNNTGAALGPGPVAWSASEAATLGLPYVQLPICEK